MEMEELQKEVEMYEEQIKTVEETIAQFEEQIKDLADKSQTTKVQIKGTSKHRMGVKQSYKNFGEESYFY